MADIRKIGVAGAGTMGSGIALTALLAGFRVVLYDVSTEMLGRAREYIEEHLHRKRRAIDLQHLSLASELEGLSGCGLVIEAVPEELSLKEALFSRLDEICPPPAILATNTSTLSVTAIAAATETPERVAGMHFFNPAPVLPLVEVIRAARTAPSTVEAVAVLAEKMGKTPVVAGDTPGFIVNRVARPFYGEALRLLGEGTATHEELDRIVRESGGFRMGPFELMDLIGIDVNYAATRSVYESTFYEPRYRPHRIQTQMVAQKALGRKTGRGFYEYVDGKPRPENPPSTVSTGKPPGAVLLLPGSWAPGLEELFAASGIPLLEPPISGVSGAVAGVIPAGRAEGMQEHLRAMDLALPPEIPILCQCADCTLAEVATWTRHPQRLVGFDGLFLSHGTVATLVAGPDLAETPRGAAETLISALGRAPLWIAGAPGLVMPRIVCALANEAAFAVGEGVADGSTIDRAMQLGTNYPKGPLAWAEELGYEKVVAVLDHLHTEYGEERYRVAPSLRGWARLNFRAD